MTPTDFTIIGGGIAGLATAVALQQKGFNTELFEAAPEIRAVGAGISLAPNALLALRKIGCETAVAEKGHILPAMNIRSSNGAVIMQTNGQRIARKYGAAHYAIHRAGLHEALLSQLRSPAVFTGKRAIGARVEGAAVVVQFQDGSEHEARALILADGIHSPIRRQLLPGSTTRYAGYTCWRAVIQYDGPIPEEASETWGPRGRFGIVPLGGNLIYWFACKSAPENDTHYKNFTTEDLSAHFQSYHSPIPEIIRQTADADLLWNDIIDLNPINQYAFGPMVLIGDAAHATTPNMGQGACQAIEDAVVLAEILGNNKDTAAAFQQFEQNRLKRTHYVVNRSWAMGKVAQAEHPLLGALRNTLFRLLPASFSEKQLKVLYEIEF